MTLWGYGRVSTVDQNPEAQRAALIVAGVDEDHIVPDHASGSRQDRPGLTQLLAQLVEGDVLVAWRLDRLGRSVSHLVRLVDELGDRGVQFRSLTESLDTTTPAGKLLFHMCAAVAEFERSLVQERTAAALAQARARGKQLGRPSEVNALQWRLIHQMRAAGATQQVIASTTGLSRPVVGRVIRGEMPSLSAKFAQIADDDGLPF